MMKQNKNGFTLLEILIALFIFTIISIIMMNALHTTLSSQSTTQKNAARTADLQLALLLLSRDFQQIVDRPIINYAGNLESSLKGDSNSITFTHGGLSNPLGQKNRATLQRVRYRIENQILLRESFEVLDQAPHTIPNQRKLFSPITVIVFEYLDDKGAFHSEWPLSNQNKSPLPRAIRVSISIPGWGKLTQLYINSGQSLAS